MATIKDVAKVAGVSISTVSHVLNGTRFVSPDTAEKVMSAVAGLHYAPSAVARSLKQSRTRTLGMLVTRSANPFFAEVVQGVEDACYRKGYQLLLSNTANDEQRQLACLQSLVERRVDGLILLSIADTPLLRQQLATLSEMPLLLLDTDIAGVKALRVKGDANKGGYQAARCLLARGRREIGFIGHTACHPVTEERLQGVRRAVAEQGVGIPDSWVIDGNLDCESGYSAMRRLLHLPERPDAVIAANDLMAMGAMRAIQEQGLRIPEDIALVGYDDIALTAYTSPPLTTIRQSGDKMGQMAAEVLIAAIAGDGEREHSVVIEPELVLRGTVAAAAQRPH